MRTIILLLLLLPALGHAESNFIPIQLPRGIQLELPRGWEVKGEDFNRIVLTSAEAAADLVGVRLPKGRVELIRATSYPPHLSYSSAQVSSTTPPAAKPEQIRTLTQEDVAEISDTFRETFSKMLLEMDTELLEYYGTRVDSINGHPALIHEYKRSSPSGPTVVQINRIFTGDQEVSVTLSYRETEGGLWKPVMAKIRQSITM